jgi:hypothetical protein
MFVVQAVSTLTGWTTNKEPKLSALQLLPACLSLLFCALQLPLAACCTAQVSVASCRCLQHKRTMPSTACLEMNTGAGHILPTPAPTHTPPPPPAACQDEEFIRGFWLQPLHPLSHPARVCQPGKQHRNRVSTDQATAGHGTGKLAGCSRSCWVRPDMSNTNQQRGKLMAAQGATDTLARIGVSQKACCCIRPEMQQQPGLCITK